MNYNSDYDIRLKTLESLGGDVTRKYDSVYSIDLEILRLMEQGGGGGGAVIQNYKGLISDPNTELIKAGDLGYNEVSEHNVKYSKYFTFLPNQRTLFLNIPSGISKTFLKVEKVGDFYNLCINKINEDKTYTWEHIQDNLQDLPELTKVPFTYIFYDETLSKNVEFPGEFAWSLDRQEIYYTSTIDGWTPELKMKGATDWNEGFYDISVPEDLSKKQRSFYVKDSDGNVINTNDINTSKIITVDPDWYEDYDKYQTEMKKAFDEINNEFLNKRIVIVRSKGFYSQPRESVLESTNVQLETNNSYSIYFLGYDKHLLRFNLQYEEGSNYYVCRLGDDKIIDKYDLGNTYVYTNGKFDVDVNSGHINELISEPTVDNEEFVVLKTKIPAYSGTDSPNNQIYWALNTNYYTRYFISKFAGIKINQDENYPDFDLIPNNEWYVIFNEMEAATYTKIIVTKAVRNVDKTLDVYLGFKGYDVDSLEFYDCTVENKGMQGNPGKWNEKNWVKVSDAQSISVDSFIGVRTRYFCTNTEGVKVDKITLFKRIK